MKSPKVNESFWLYGKHTCISALKNKNRKCIELLITKNFYKEHKKEIRQYADNKGIRIQLVENKTFNNILSKRANHQGIALKVTPILHSSSIEEIAENSSESSTIIILDQITDTRNIGSILRTSACFNVDAAVLSYNYSPSENASIAKAASGALDIIPLIYVTNMVKTIEHLKKAGYWCYGFDSNAKKHINEMKSFWEKRVIIFGSEEKGIRRLIKKNCDYLLKIPISNVIDSLNVSNAAAIGLYSIYTKTQHIKIIK
ncbi:23S rRNA (guanosine(2251)-2'-O)-methyltransferase RlmB [Wolbachia endosymbiont of Dirofilaria (Dirofilaria) immitis]|uniref:23S rRNA (guanosine(2251)-2'-O)-methyltransferase RlmB n=1 Tax=Wolbachia endosymbiont of Dirofilaria (Dirofilaria) immitis TaxID=1812115 RepID=UPI00158A43DC|nr:23S rRNA (guanosine(2251)-2'-O)-methyltransferase RlmB [Wolbachia endosymbiont of Dirofilaria (Dirofilaria) immitis]QKX02184.1 23S rRNA (guanosine(2251)-2'-O)-methyltransferase RlmB [Wolbachia endosymbiont of Dirofilaria (Dirofilaria) immitis]